MFPEIKGGTQMQPKKIGGTCGKKFENPCATSWRLFTGDPERKQSYSPFLDDDEWDHHEYDEDADADDIRDDDSSLTLDTE